MIHIGGGFLNQYTMFLRRYLPGYLPQNFSRPREGKDFKIIIGKHKIFLYFMTGMRRILQILNN